MTEAKDERLFNVMVHIEYLKNKDSFSFCLDSQSMTGLFEVKSFEVTQEFKVSLDKVKMVEGVKEALLSSGIDHPAIKAIANGERFDFVPKHLRNMDWAVGAVRITQFCVDMNVRDLLDKLVNDFSEAFYEKNYSKIGRLEIEIESLESQTPVTAAERGARLYHLTRKKRILEELLNFKQYSPSTASTSGVWSFWDFEKNCAVEDV
jgi:hypothetical protein